MFLATWLIQAKILTNHLQSYKTNIQKHLKHAIEILNCSYLYVADILLEIWSMIFQIDCRRYL